MSQGRVAEACGHPGPIPAYLHKLIEELCIERKSEPEPNNAERPRDRSAGTDQTYSHGMFARFASLVKA
ncbi:Uu.00g098280.m01.CDS01 [Anthostomella pinea]|uniref:Uu.00g098280.m01.CDS01 n=1 Tax=Anthostomella pinea TaxID=933095 RepID=A0AAI8VCF8_9PEZI|nr:Uu.00g098280.m01.CDS01 [Anthostomella pinea]